MTDVYWHGLGFTTSATFTDSKILSDSLAPWFEAIRCAHSAHPAPWNISYARTTPSRSPPQCASRPALREPREYRFQSRHLWQHGQLLSRLRREGAVQIRAGLDRDRRINNIGNNKAFVNPILSGAHLLPWRQIRLRRPAEAANRDKPGAPGSGSASATSRRRSIGDGS